MEPRLEPIDEEQPGIDDEYFDVDSITFESVLKAENQYEAYLDRRWDK